MESLVNYESDDESGDFNEGSKNESNNAIRIEEDVNYDDIGMDESSEESNNNHSEGHLNSVSREKESSLNRNFRNSKDYDSSESYGNSNFDFESKLNKKQDRVDFGLCENSRKKQDFSEGNGQVSGENSPSKSGYLKEEYEGRNNEALSLNEVKHKKIGLELTTNNDNSKAKGSEELIRRHSSDMEMDDGEDDLQNYKDSKDVETVAEYRQKYTQKSINFTKSKDLNTSDDSQKKGVKVPPYQSAGSQIKQNDNKSINKNHRSAENETNLTFEESQKSKDDKFRQKDKEKNFEDRKKDDYKKKDEKDRKKDDDRCRESDRDRRRDTDKFKDDRERERKRSPDRHGRKRSHSPDRRDRDRDRDRDRVRERDRDRDRDREREYRSSDRRSPKRSRSPERSWKTRKLEKKAAVLNKLGIEIKADASGTMTPRQLLGEQLKAQILEVEAKTGITLPTYYNPGVMNPLKYAQQIQKRKLLWGNKNNESKSNESAGQGSSAPSNVKQWEAATFKGDSDGKMTEKFKRLMGIKGDSSIAGNTITKGSKPPETKELIQKQEEMFSNMEAQYQVARMATHTHRGVGLGFGTFQVPPR